MSPRQQHATKADFFLNLGALACAGILLFCTDPTVGGQVGDPRPDGDPYTPADPAGDPNGDIDYGDIDYGDTLAGDIDHGDYLTGDAGAYDCSILSPSSSVTYRRREPVPLIVDAGAGTVTSVEWDSDVDGSAFATGENVTTLDLSVGTHELSATVEYSDGSTCTTSSVQTPVVANEEGVIDTGMSECSDNSVVHDCGTMVTHLGQDGMVTGTMLLSFTDNGDGTLSNGLGFTWQQQDDDIEYNWYEAAGVYDAVYNPNTTDACGNLALGGHEDWRLPTRRELLSIVNYGANSPTIDPLFTGTSAIDPYWSADVLAISDLYAWAVTFQTGGTIDYIQTSADYPAVYVRCVRGTMPVGPYLVDHGDGTITDEATGLMWQQGDAPPSIWSEALDYCNTLELATYDDWRLPDVRELESIVDITLSGTVAPSPFVVEAARYATSTPVFGQPLFAWGVGFGDGRVAYTDKVYESNRVRCVRLP